VESFLLFVKLFIFFAVVGALVSFVARYFETMLLSGLAGIVTFMIVDVCATAVNAAGSLFFKMSLETSRLTVGYGFVLAMLLGFAVSLFVGYLMYQEQRALEKHRLG
jgi:mannitol-specific phosphotransferase system IIBC component